jgi:pyoverdine/dityrosine biosynthesis protein Dit1
MFQRQEVATQPIMLGVAERPRPEKSTRIDSGVSTSGLEPNVEDTSTVIASKALKIIQSYGVNQDAGYPDFLALFLPVVTDHVRNNTPIKLVLPAFPAKSPNRVDKVLGHLPDFGEELALAHLDGLCKAIGEVYRPGAEIFIASDGIVYSGMLLESLDTVIMTR